MTWALYKIANIDFLVWILQQSSDVGITIIPILLMRKRTPEENLSQSKWRNLDLNPNWPNSKICAASLVAHFFWYVRQAPEGLLVAKSGG